MLKIKELIRKILKVMFELCAIVYPYGTFLQITNTKDEITLLNCILSFIYCVVALNLFEWCFDLR